MRSPLDRTDRVEIPNPIKAQAYVRAGGLKPMGPFCEGEGCGLPLKGKCFHYDHKYPECFQNVSRANRPPITLEDVQVLGEDCCHKPKSRAEVRQLAKGKRQFKKEARIDKPKRVFPGSKRDWRSKGVDGTVRDRRTGKVLSQ